MGSSMREPHTLRGEPAGELFGRVLVPAAQPVVAALEASNRPRPGNGGTAASSPLERHCEWAGTFEWRGGKTSA